MEHTEAVVSTTEAEECAESASGRGVKEWAKIMGKTIIKTVQEVSDAFPPLKSVAAGVKMIVERAEVRCNVCTLFQSILTRGGWYS